MIAVFLIGVAAVLLLHGFRYQRNWTRALSVRVLFSSPHVYVNDILELTEIIENRKKMALPILEIGFRLPRGVQFEDAENIRESDYLYKRDIFAVRGMERIVRRYHLTALRRGFYSVSQLTCHAPSRLFRHTFMMDRMTQEGDSGLFVYAANVDTSLLLRAVEVILGERECARRLYEDPFVFSSIRPYTIRDPMKSVNWKATAKTGELMVNTYASTSAVRVRIFLDVSADPGVFLSDSFREYGIAMAASLIRTLVKDQRDASLVVNCPAPKDNPGVQDNPGLPEPDRVQPGSGTRMHAGISGSSLKQEVSPNYICFPSCTGAGRMAALEEFLTTDFDSCSLLPFEEMIRQEAEKKPGAMAHLSGASDLSSNADDEVFVFIAYTDHPSLRAQIRKLLGLRRSGLLAVLSRNTGRREERERNLFILPVTEPGQTYR